MEIFFNEVVSKRTFCYLDISATLIVSFYKSIFNILDAGGNLYRFKIQFNIYYIILQ